MDKLARRVWRSIRGVAALGCLLLVWELIGRANLISPLALPLPSAILLSSLRQPVVAEFWFNWFSTLTLWLLSFGTGVVFGVGLGFATGVRERVWGLLFPSLAYIRAIPPIVLFPIALVALGAGNSPIYAVAAASCMLYMFPQIADASRDAKRRYRELATVLEMSEGSFIKLIMVPATLFSAASSLRVAATLTFAVCVAGEVLVGGRQGVGAAIVTFTERYELAKAYSYVAYAGLLGLLVDVIGVRIASRARTWELSTSLSPDKAGL